MKYCLNCKLYFSEQVSFCTQCGASFNVRYCSRRLHLNSINAKYCKLCGTSDLSKPNPVSSNPVRRFPLFILAAVVLAATPLFIVLFLFYLMAPPPPSFVFLGMVIAAILLAGFRRSGS